jgi:hypothetical protein
MGRSWPSFQSGVQYAKGFLATSKLQDLADLKAPGKRWVMHEEGLRTQVITHQQPWHCLRWRS